MSGGGGRRRRGGHEEEHENHERWLVTYADMLTVLMALFIVMFALSVVDKEKFQKFAEGVNGDLGNGASLLSGGPGLQQAGDTPVDLQSAITALNDNVTPKTVKVTAVPENGEAITFDAVLRIDTPGEADYYRNGGILQYVLRQISAK